MDRLQLKNEELLRKIDRVKHERDQNTSQDGKLQRLKGKELRMIKLVAH